MNIWFTNPDEILKKTTLVSRFLEYVKIDTEANPESTSFPSTKSQLEFGRKLLADLKALGLSDATMDENGYVFARYPGRVKGPCVGLLAHMDTAPDFTGKDVRPQIHENYGGGILRLKNGVVLNPAEDRHLPQCVGHTLITTDGTTLLGADDKAGVAELFALVEFLNQHPDIPIPPLSIGFTPDEEIGRGADRFDINRFGADIAYTVDIQFPGEINIETFCADTATLTFTGIAIHPGNAKGKMVNALRYAAKILERLPENERPETTDEREGYYNPSHISGNGAQAKLVIFLRDFAKKGLKKRGDFIRKLVSDVLKGEPRLRIHLAIIPRYRNMANVLKKRPEIARKAEESVRRAGLTPVFRPIRGGTDGANLTAKGLPTINLFSGSVNAHGPTEWVSTKAMGYAVCTLLNLLQLWGSDRGQ
ncbi:MAG: peptidase T [Fibrobacteres bacterium]|nr:peptidase T [Fibrobacterota bacterium]